MFFFVLVAAAVAVAVTPPKLLPGMTIGDADYPPVAMRNEQTGTVAFALDVDAAGVPGRCVVTKSSRFPALDEQTCRIALRRMHFEPARDGAGNPVAAVFASRMRWAMKVAPPAEFGDATVTTTVRIGDDGTIADCATTTSGVPSTAIGIRCSPGLIFAIDSLLGAPHQDFATVTLIGTMTTRPGSAVPAAAGAHLSSVTARFSVDATGLVEDCVVAADARVGTLTYDICQRALSLRPDFFVAAPPGTVRAGTVGLEIYGVRRAR